MADTLASRLNSQFFGGNPFDNIGELPGGFIDEGWASYPEVLDTVIGVVKPKVIIEVGVWLGQSTFNMLDKALEIDPDCSIICVDTWLGSPEHWLNSEWLPQLRIEAGRPNMYPIFVNNVKLKGVEQSVVPMSMTSLQAAKVLKSNDVVADLVYLDGAHDRDEVLSDIQNYWPLIKDGGCMVGDDYCDEWPGVVEALHYFKKDRDDIEFVHARDKFVLYKV